MTQPDPTQPSPAEPAMPAPPAPSAPPDPATGFTPAAPEHPPGAGTGPLPAPASEYPDAVADRVGADHLVADQVGADQVRQPTAPIDSGVGAAPVWGPPNQPTAPIGPGHDSARQLTAPIGPDPSIPPLYGYGPPPAPPPVPPKRTGSRLVLVLAPLAVVLAAALTVTAILGFRQLGKLHDQAAGLRAERDADNRAAEAVTTKQKADLATADLRGKLKHVHDLDAAADTAFGKWTAGTEKFGVLDEAMDHCDEAVDAYNRAAAPFPAALLGDLPHRLDITQPATDCGRAFTDSI